jgi:glycerol-3-phosphate dehydrogenase
MFTFPHEQNSMAGTTDDDFYGDLDALDVTEDEVRYVMQAMERSIPSIRRHRVLHTLAGVRPTLYGFGRYEDELSRDYALLDHGERDGVRGFYSLAGGKLAAYRLMAEDACDRICAVLGVSEPCRTATTPLPGGEEALDVGETARRFRCDWPAVVRLAFRHGARAPRVLEESRAPRTVCACEPVLDAELCHVARHEGVRKLTDCTARVRLGVGACQGAACAGAAGEVLADALGWSAERTAAEVAEFAAERWRSVAPVLGGTQLAAMEIHRAVHRGARAWSAPVPGATSRP